MHGYVLQDWITLTSNGLAITNVIQDEEEWLDLGDYRDLQIWLDVSDVDLGAGSATLNVETSALREDFFFSSIESFTLSSPGLFVRSEMADYMCGIRLSMPLARWLRWNVTLPASVSNVTFRIAIAVGGVGTGQVPERLRNRLTEEWHP